MTHLIGCEHRLEGPTPQLDAELSPHLVCNELEPMTRVTFTGDGLAALPRDTALEPAYLELPGLVIRRRGDLLGEEAVGAEIGLPDEQGDSLVHWYSQQSMAFDVTPDLSLPEGVYDLTLTNPDGQQVTVEAALAVVPPPELTGVTPETICVDQQDVTVTLLGAGFLDIDGALPSVEVSDGSQRWLYEPVEMTDCFTLPEPATEAQSCAGLSILIPQGSLDPGVYEITVTNPEPANCSSSETITFEVVPPPELDSVSPSQVCTGGGEIGLQGSGFRPGATVEAGGLVADSVEVAPGGESATATFGAGLDEGTFDVTFTNADGCSDTLEAAVEVIQGPIIFWVDPPVVYSGISTQVTIYGSGLSEEVRQVELDPADGGEAVTLEFSLDVARGRLQAVVPMGTPAGEYDVVVRDEVCPAILPGGLVVTDSLTLSLDAVDPPFGWADRDTSVSLFGGGFVTTPRAYLNPETPTAETVATALSSVAFVDASRLTAVVQAGLPVGVYDLIVVNPTGEVGLIEGGFTVTDDAPPEIDSVSPGEVDNGDVHSLDVRGSGFDGPSASWLCRAPSGATSTPAATVGASTATSAEVTLDANDLTSGTVCVLRLTNPDGAYGEYSAVAVTNPSANLADVTDGTSLTTARRAPALVSGRATRSARFLYALGGDGGNVGGALASSESASVDIFGELGAWFEQPNGLPGPLTLAGARTLGRFIYLVGGHDGAAPTDEVWRAEILDPAEAPTILDITVRQGDDAGLGQGIWYYRVSALFPEDHPTNPGGESLASDPLVINLPDTLDATLLITLIWSAVDGAEAYRIYRSPSPDLASGSELQLAEVPAGGALEYEDDGATTPAGASPLPLGAHGTWAALAPLSAPRAGFGLGQAVDPDDPTTTYLYAVGGETDGGAALASYELLAIAVASERDQTPAGAWVDGTGSMLAARHQTGLYSVDHLAASRVAEGTTYLYAVGGLDGTGDHVDTSEVARVGAGGQLEAFEELSSPRNAAGFAAAAAGNFLYLFGGGPTASNDVSSAEICGAGLSCTGGPDDPPDVQNWNNEGGASLSPARYLPGSTLESAFIYIVGGVDGGGAALRSTDQVVW